MFFSLAWNSKGENNKRAKLNEAKVKEIRTLYSRGEKQKTLAERFGVSLRTISGIVTYTSWCDRVDYERD